MWLARDHFLKDLVSFESIKEPSGFLKNDLQRVLGIQTPHRRLECHKAHDRDIVVVMVYQLLESRLRVFDNSRAEVY